jgi:predicted tellurium resistance membrane protein TerC
MLLTFLQRLGGVLIAVVLTIAALIFASVILAVAAAIAIVVGGWLWWRTRDVRRELRRRDLEGTADVERAESAVIEGEYRRIDER